MCEKWPTTDSLCQLFLCVCVCMFVCACCVVFVSVVSSGSRHPNISGFIQMCSLMVN